jgi:hypothetical protein
MVCQATTAGDERIRIAAFSCLHEIAANYYAKLPAYITEIFKISIKAIQEDSEDVGLQVGARVVCGVRAWCVCVGGRVAGAHAMCELAGVCCW